MQKTLALGILLSAAIAATSTSLFAQATQWPVGAPPAAGVPAEGVLKPGERPPYLDSTQPAEARAKDLIARMTLEEKATSLNHNGPAVERFNILSDK